MTRADIAALLARRLDALTRRDTDALARLYADDCVVESPMAGTGEGRAAVARVYDAFFSAFPDVTHTTDEPIIDGDRAAQGAVVTGTDTGGFMGLPPTGKAFRFSVMHGYVFRDGLIVREQRVYDFTGLLIQIGIMKAKPA